jgi:hypothetical protein
MKVCHAAERQKEQKQKTKSRRREEPNPEAKGAKAAKYAVPGFEPGSEESEPSVITNYTIPQTTQQVKYISRPRFALRPLAHYT